MPSCSPDRRTGLWGLIPRVAASPYSLNERSGRTLHGLCDLAVRTSPGRGKAKPRGGSTLDDLLTRRVTTEPLDGVVREGVVDHLRRLDPPLHVVVVDPPLDVVGEGAHVDVAIRVQADRTKLFEHCHVFHRRVATEDVEDLRLVLAAREGVIVIAEALDVG